MIGMLNGREQRQQLAWAFLCGLCLGGLASARGLLALVGSSGSVVVP
jgi:hypothetical protein